MTRLATWRGLAAAALFVVLAPASAVELGQVAPDTAGPRLMYDQSMDLADLRGKVVLIDFWASWCGPCKLSLPDLETLRAELVAAGYPAAFEMLAINVDEDPQAAKRFIQRYPVSYPIISDPAGRLAEAWGIPTMPTSYVVNGSGVVVWQHEGYKPGDIADVRAAIMDHLPADAR